MIKKLNELFFSVKSYLKNDIPDFQNLSHCIFNSYY